MTKYSRSIHVMHHVTMVRMLSFYEYSTRLSTRRLRFEMAPKKKAAKDAATDIPQVCWCYSALNDPFEDLLIDPEIGDNVFTLGKMTPYCHYVAAQRDSAITTTPPKKQRTLDPKSEANASVIHKPEDVWHIAIEGITISHSLIVDRVYCQDVGGKTVWPKKMSLQELFNSDFKGDHQRMFNHLMMKTKLTHGVRCMIHDQTGF